MDDNRENHGVAYAFIECVLTDEEELRRRMRGRQRQRSQRVALDQAPPDAPTDVMMTAADKVRPHQTKYPPGQWLQVDTSQSIEQNIKQSLAYLQGL